MEVAVASSPVNGAGYRMKLPTRVGLFKGANNMPGGWLLWLFERYGLDHRIVTATDFSGDLGKHYDAIVLPHGTSRERIRDGLDPARHDPAKWAWAFGVGEAGLDQLRAFVEGGGTLVAIGSASETARELFGLPIEKALPESQRLRPYAGTVAERGEGEAEPADAADLLRRALQSPARLMTTLRDEVVDPESLFYCPGSLLAQEFDTSHPVAFGMPERWPVFFESDQAYRLTPGFQARASIASRYPAEGPLLESGWLLGEEYLRNQANAISFEVGKGTVVVLASQIDYRAQPRATFKLLFNAIYQGPATAISARELASLRSGSTD
jgi:hypothetical protein